MIQDYRIDYKCANCIMEFAKHVIAYLEKKHFLIIEGSKILPTPLGKAAFASSISPEESMLIFDDLLQARESSSLVLETDLHLLYLITPHFKSLREPNWEAFIRLFKQLSAGELEVAKIYNIDLDYMHWALHIKPKLPDFISDRQDMSKPGGEQQVDKEADFAMCLAEKMSEGDFKLVRYCRFYMALMANYILCETPMPEICHIFGDCSRGQV